MTNREKLLDAYYRTVLLNSHIKDLEVDDYIYRVVDNDVICIEEIKSSALDKDNNIYIPDGFDALSDTAFINYENTDFIINILNLGTISGLCSLVFGLVSIKHLVGPNIKVLDYMSLGQINAGSLCSLDFENVIKVNVNCFSYMLSSSAYKNLEYIRFGSLVCNNRMECLNFLDYLDESKFSTGESDYLDIDEYVSGNEGI